MAKKDLRLGFPSDGSSRDGARARIFDSVLVFLRLLEVVEALRDIAFVQELEAEELLFVDVPLDKQFLGTDRSWLHRGAHLLRPLLTCNVYSASGARERSAKGLARVREYAHFSS